MAAGVGMAALATQCSSASNTPPYAMSQRGGGGGGVGFPDAGSSAADAGTDGGLDPTELLTSLSPTQLGALCDAIWGATSYGMTLSVACDGGMQSVTAPLTRGICVSGLTYTSCEAHVSDVLGCDGPGGACGGSSSAACTNLAGCM